jgi:polyhydroxyalkanoate synthesis regulator phasin
MNYRDLAVDRIHYLVERAQDLYRWEMFEEGDLLMEQAGEIADDLREESQTVSV